MPRLIGTACLSFLLVPCSLTRAQECPATGPADVAAVYSTPPATYPRTSHRYAVQYRVDDGDWTDARVYISGYGETNASPFIAFVTGYLLARDILNGIRGAAPRFEGVQPNQLIQIWPNQNLGIVEQWPPQPIEEHDIDAFDRRFWPPVRLIVPGNG